MDGVRKTIIVCAAANSSKFRVLRLVSRRVFSKHFIRDHLPFDVMIWKLINYWENRNMTSPESEVHIGYTVSPFAGPAVIHITGCIYGESHNFFWILGRFTHSVELRKPIWGIFVQFVCELSKRFKFRNSITRWYNDF